MKYKLSPKTLTLIIKDVSPLIYEEEPVQHRTVHIELTEDQRVRLECLNNANLYEEISFCFLEDMEA
jgi:hypothetical protein